MTTETQSPDPDDEKRADFERKVSSYLSPLHLLSLERDADTGRYLDHVIYGAWWGYRNAAPAVPAIPAPEGAQDDDQAWMDKQLVKLPAAPTHADLRQFAAAIRQRARAALAAPAPKATVALTDEQIDAGVQAWFMRELDPPLDAGPEFRARMRAAIKAAQGAHQ